MLEILISSSVLILVLATLRLVLREKISARLQYALWLLVLVRLLVPMSFFHSPVSVAEAASPMTEQAWSASHRVLYAWNTPGSAPPESAGVATQLDEGGVINSGDVLLLRDALLFTWYAGMVVMAFWFLFVNVRLARRLKKNRTPFDYNSVMPVYVAEGIPSPCLFGLFKPSIYLTERAAEDDTRARQIIAHELTHYHHGDMIWSLLRSVCLVVWWFNPFVWLAAALSRQDCELACDEGTIKALGEDARFDYGRTLVGMAKVGARPSDLLCGATTMTTGKKSLKERVARIANAPKMSVTVAVIVLIIAAVAVGCTFSGAEEKMSVGPEIAIETTQENAAASDAEDLEPKWMELYYSHEAVTTSHDAEEVQAFFDVYRSVRALAVPPSDDFTVVSGDPIFSINLYPAAVGYMDYPVIYSLLLLEDEWFVLPDEADPVNGQALVWQDKNGLYSGMLEDLIDQFHSESSAAEFVSDEIIGTYDRAYWEEVDRELASFAYPANIEVFISPYFEFDESLPEDDISGPLTLEDYIYGTDGWKFSYDSEPIANDPAATIKVHDADGRILWIMDDADALMIEEADGSITWVAYTSDPVDCADMIRHLLPWARGEYPAETPAPPVDEAQQERTEPILAELGLYTLSGQEPKNVDGSTDYYNELPNHPLWSKLITMEFQDYVDLVYSRWWSDEDLSEPANEEFFAYIQSSTAEVYRQTTGLSVNGHEAFSYTDTIGFVSIVWLDEQSNLIFQLYDPILHGETAATDNELIALAESVTAQ